MASQNVIGLCGRAFSGKTTVAKHLLNLNPNIYGRFSCAEPIKDMLKVLGLSDEQLYGAHKEHLDFQNLGGNSARHAMVTLGTEWGREMIYQDIWVDALERKIKQSGFQFALIDDVRFPNEVAMVRRNGGLVLAIERPGVAKPSSVGHASETMSFEEQGIQIIQNDSTVADLLSKVVDVIGTHFYGK